MRGTLHVYTWKDGLLSRLAHDLRLVVPGLRVTLAEGRVTGRFDPTSARVEGVANGEHVDAAALSDKDKRTIEATIRDEVLGREPVRFEGVVRGERVAGRLSMRGRAVDLDLPVRAGLVVDTILVPSRWGIAPYRALGGALKLQDRWRVRLTLPWEGGPLATAAAEWTGR